MAMVLLVCLVGEHHLLRNLLLLPPELQAGQEEKHLLLV